MDMVFYGCGEHMIDKHDDSRTAMDLLEQMKTVIAKGQQERHLQRTPHLILLSTRFYYDEMHPLLCQWMGLWLASKKGLSSLAPGDILAYLHKGPKDVIVAALVAGKVFGEFAKMLNLAHDWLSSFLPFTLAKINRVAFGLLSAKDLRKALEIDPGMPKSRRLLAVPFVGKDVPSRSSEFAHPDVLIGNSILAYRYEGLRESDFLHVLRNLKQTLHEESGPYSKRLSAKLFESWVVMTGRRVRGSRMLEAEKQRKKEELFKTAETREGVVSEGNE
jgi:hypothetical protein